MNPRVILKGDKNRAESLRGEAMRQMFILKNAMQFQGLKQLKRIANLSDGSRIVCSSVFGIDNIHIEAVGVGKQVISVKEAYFCWCNSCFAEGVISEVIGTVGDFGPFWKDVLVYDEADKFYSEYCKNPDSNIRRYEGIRYKVKVCQGEIGRDQEFICIPTDFAGHQVDDKVIVLFMGAWDGSTRNDPVYLENFAECHCINMPSGPFLCEACMASRRESWLTPEADGSFLVTAMKVQDING